METEIDEKPSVEKETNVETNIDEKLSAENESVDSAANSVNEVPPNPSKKLRILCIHGFRTSGSILAQQLESAGWTPLMDDIAELVFIDAPWPAKGKSDVEKKFAGPYFEWYNSNEDYTVAYGLEKGTSHFSDCVSSHGPFDGLLGFSQGAVLASAWMGLSEKGLEPNIPNVHFLILVGAAKGREKFFHQAYSDTIKCPSLHFIGDKDFMKQYSEELLPAFKDPILIRHPFSHTIPKLGDTEGQPLRDFLLKQLQSKIAS